MNDLGQKCNKKLKVGDQSHYPTYKSNKKKVQTLQFREGLKAAYSNMVKQNVYK